MKKEIVLALKEIMAERQVPPEVLRKALEAGLKAAYRKEMNASQAQEIQVNVDIDTGEYHILVEKEVVEEVQNPGTEVALAEARQIDPEAALGDTILVDSTPTSFGRVAAQTARQVIQQNIREAERELQAAHFRSQISEMVSGVVQARTRQGYTIGLDMHAEGLLPDSQKIPGEYFQIHDRIRAVVQEVKAEKRAPRIILSRTHKNFLRRLLENEVPEIYRGIVEIRSIAREPGRRAKVAVSSNQAGVDPVGACVGGRGVRVQAIVDELHGEKIDIIEWNADPTIFIKKALSPAVVSGVYIQPDAEKRTATVVVADEQLSLAIGRNGQNARLAAKLTGWRIDIKSIAEAASEALALLEENEELQALLPAAAEEMPLAREILAGYAENNHLTLENQLKLTKFIERVEQGRARLREEAAKRREAERANIPASLFDRPLADLDVPEYVFNIISEDDYNSLGDFILTYNLTPEKIFGKPGIGPKAQAAIETAVAAALEQAALETAAAEAAAEAAAPAAAEDAPPAELADESAAAEEPDAAPVAAEPAEAEEAEPQPEAIEDLFKQFAASITAEAEPAAEEAQPDEGRKKKKKKKKKGEYLEFDEELGRTVKRRKRKRGGDDFFDEDLDW